MKKFNLVRVLTGPLGTLGTLTTDNALICFTLEPQWLNNQKNISCVPAGTYEVQIAPRSRLPRLSKKFPDIKKFPLLTNVVGRGGIAIHPFNDITETEGCIGPGEWVDTSNGGLMIRNSVVTFNKLMALVGQDTAFSLRIHNCWSDVAGSVLLAK